MGGQALGGSGGIVDIAFIIFQSLEVGESSIVAPLDGLGYGVPVGGAVVEFEFRLIKT